jgi:PAS domain-containing protein
VPLVVIVGNTNPLITAAAKQGLVIGGIALVLIILVTSISIHFIISSYADVKRNEARYKQLYKSIRDGLILLDAQGYILKCNDAFLDITGYERDEQAPLR